MVGRPVERASVASLQSSGLFISLALGEMGRVTKVVDLQSALFANDGVISSRIRVSVTEMQAQILACDKLLTERAPHRSGSICHFTL